MKSLEDTLLEGIRILEQVPVTEAKADAWLLFQEVFGLNRAEYFLNSKNPVSEKEYGAYCKFIQKREDHTPVQYIIGSTEFMGLPFRVDKNVLIPRQDTEVLVETVMKMANDKTVLDMCTGSGCIIISLAKLCVIPKAVGVDISPDALKVARENAIENEASVQFIQSNLFEGVEGRYDIIVSNPPYIPTNDIEELMPEVKTFEPRMALDGKEDGLYFYREIINSAKEYLNQEGLIYFEIGYDQGEDVKNLLKKAGFSSVQVIQDLAGFDRVVFGTL